MLDRVKTFYGVDLYIPTRSPLYSPLKEKGIYERREARYIQGLLKPGDVFLDLGANIGYYTILAALKVGTQGRVIAVEPDSKVATMLAINVFSVGLQNVVIVEEAVVPSTNGENVVGFFPDQQLGGVDGRCFPVPGRKEREVTCHSLLKYLAEPRFDFVKIDVQGLEPQLFDDLALLTKCKSNVNMMLEYEPRLFNGATHAMDFVESLVSMGFIVGALETPSPLQRFSTTKQLDSYLIGRKTHHINLMCLRDQNEH